jgi:bacterioferritin-associated ferredoxin
MACALHPATEAGQPSGEGPASALPPAGFPRAVPRAMTRCECAGISFQEVATRMAATGASLEDASARTGCGRNCTACLPDLLTYLAGR